MSRVQFVETVTAPAGINGSLIPLIGVGATPYVVDVNGIEGGQANAYAARNGATAASSMVTDVSGTVSYWLDAGDYNIHFEDQQAPPRVANYIRGFTAPVINTDQLVVGAQNLIQFTGDTKFSMQSVDHGVKTDGSFEWLLVIPDSDGGGRQVDGTIYAVLRQLLGNPALTSGKFRLPNISGRALIAAGAAATAGGITTSARHLLDMFGAEAVVLDSTMMPSHSHGGTTGNDSPDHWHSDGGHSHGPDINAGTDMKFVYDHAGVALNGQVSNTGGTTMIATNGPISISGVTGAGNASIGGAVTAATAGRHAHSIPLAGGGLGHSNIGPSTGMNLFVKT